MKRPEMTDDWWLFRWRQPHHSWSRWPWRWRSRWYRVGHLNEVGLHVIDKTRFDCKAENWNFWIQTLVCHRMNSFEPTSFVTLKWLKNTWFPKTFLMSQALWLLLDLQVSLYLQKECWFLGRGGAHGAFDKIFCWKLGQLVRSHI